MKPDIHAPQLPIRARSGSSGLDIVVPFTTRPLTRAALSDVGRLSAGLLPLIRMVRIQVVPFPLPLEAAPVTAAVLRRQLAPMAAEFDAHIQVCYARDMRQALLHCLRADSVVLLAAHRRFWRPCWPSQEERLARWLRKKGCTVMLEFVEKDHA